WVRSFDGTYAVSYNGEFLHDFILLVEGFHISVCHQTADGLVGFRRLNLFRTVALALLAVASLFSGLSLAAQQSLIEDIQVRGNRRIPAETVKQRIFSRPGDVYDPQALERDFNSLWNTGYYDDLRFERQDTPKGV